MSWWQRPRERFQADALSGAILQFLGRWSEAEEHYLAALRFDPTDRDLRRRLAVSIAEQAMLAPDPDARRSGLEEALRIVQTLIAEQPEAELDCLAANLRAAVSG